MSENQAWGIAIVAASVLCFVAGWRLHARGRVRAAVGLLVLGGLLLRAFASADLFLHDWDERYHALVAKNLRAHPLRPTLYEQPLLPYDHRQWVANHVWLHKPPLPLWLMALSLAALGLNEVALRLPSLLVSLAGIALTYDLGRRLFDSRTGMMAALLQALSGFLIDRASGRQPTDHVDTLFVFLVQAGIWVAVRDVGAGRWSPGRALALGLLTGLAFLTKWLAALLVPAVWMLMLGARRREARAPAVALAAATLVALPWQLYARFQYPLEFGWERAYDWRHLFEPLEGHAGPAWFHLAWMGRFYGELVYLPVVWFLVRAARERGWRKLGVAAWFVLPYAFFSLVATKMPAYVMIAGPSLFLMQGWYWWLVRDWVAASGRRWPGFLLLAALLLLPARYMVERVRPFSADRRTRHWAHELKALGARLGPEPCVLVNVPRPIEAMFYSSCVAYPSAVDAATATALQHRGYRVFAHDDGRLPADLVSHPGVGRLRLATD